MSINALVPNLKSWPGLDGRGRPDSRKTREIEQNVQRLEAQLAEIHRAGGTASVGLANEISRDQAKLGQRAVVSDRLFLLESSRAVEGLRDRIAAIEREAGEINAQAATAPTGSPEHGALINEAISLEGEHVGASQQLGVFEQERDALRKLVARWQ